MTFVGWLSDPLKGLSDLQLGDEKVTLNHLESIFKPTLATPLKINILNPKKVVDGIMTFLFTWVIFRFYVKFFGGCNCLTLE